MKKVMLLINVLFLIAICIGNYFYITIGGLLIKSITSILFAGLGLLNMGYAIRNTNKNHRFYILMCVGLFLAMLGDIFLEINFIFGASLFALGHIGFLLAYSILRKFKILDIIINLIIFISVASFILFSPIVVINDPIMKCVCLIYAFIISIMLGKALGNFISHPNFVNGVIAFGSLLFTISDFMLLLNMFVGLWSWTGKVCLATYYPAEWLLAYSMYALSQKNR